MITAFITDDPAIIDMLEHFVDLDYSDLEYDDWYCIQIKPMRCSCGEVVTFASDDLHMILIWQDKDDDKLLELAIILREGDFEPFIVNYTHLFGPCIEFEDAVRLGTMENGFIRY